MALESGQTGITLIGLPGVGKSTLGKTIAPSFPGWSFHDHDSDGMEDSNIGLGHGGVARELEKIGDRAFLKYERDFTLQNYGRAEEWRVFSLDQTILASSGSVVRSPEIMEHLRKRTHVILLQIPVSRVLLQIQQRSDAASRIIGMNGWPNGELPMSPTLEDELRFREFLYEQYCDSIVPHIPGESLHKTALRLYAHIEQILK